MKKLSILAVCLLTAIRFVYPQDEDTWKKVHDLAAENMVLIEYYEELESTGSISAADKIKRSLNGVIVSKDGLVLTSASIYKAKLGFSGVPHFGTSNPPSDITVRLNSGKELKAEFVGKDDDKNVAFVKIVNPMDHKGTSFISDFNHAIGQKIFIVFQLEEEYNFQLMIVEKKINSVIPGPPQKLLTEATLPTEFGLVCDNNGNAIGILQTDKSVVNFSFDYKPVEKNFVEILLSTSFTDLIKKPPVYEKKNTSRKKWLGVNMQPFTREMASYFKVPEIKGILINTVLKDSPAEKAGIQQGDVFIEFNGYLLSAENNTDLQVFRNLVREFNGDVAEVAIWRDGKILKKQIELAELPISQYLADEVSNELLGFTAKELTKDIILAKQLSFDANGVWISKVERASWADLSGLNVGDLLLKIDNVDLQDLNQLNTYLKKVEKTKPKYINFFVKRRSETRYLFIKTNFN